MSLIIFAEFVSSNNFYILLLETLNLLTHTSLGTYLQGIPIANTVNFVWGTNAGIRTLPILLFLTLLQEIFPKDWAYIYLGIALVLPFLIFILAYKLINKITIFSIIGALFYAGNVWIINRFYTGFWQLNISYAFLPLLIAITIKVTQLKKNINRSILYLSILYGITASIVLTSQPHFLILVGIFNLLVIIDSLIKKNYNTAYQQIKLYMLAACAFILLNLYFLLPGLLFSEPYFTAKNQYFSIGSVIFNGQGNLIQHVLRFDHLGFSQENFSWTWLESLQLIPIIFTFIVFILTKKRNYIFFSLIILFLFLSKGLNPPGIELSMWIYKNVFFMHFFRDPSRFLAGVALFASFIIAEYQFKLVFSKMKRIFITIVVIIFILLINTKSVKSGKFEVLQPTNIPFAYLKVQQYVNSHLANQEASRMLSLPNKHGLSAYPWYNNKIPNTANTIFDSALPLHIPLANSTNYPDTFSNQVSTYLYSQFTQSYDSSYLRPLGVNYLLVDSIIKSPQIEKDIATKSSELLERKGYPLLFNEQNLSLFKVVSNSPIVSLEKPLFAIGDLSTIAKLSKQEITRPVILLNQQIDFNDVKDNLVKGNDIFFDSTEPLLTLTSERLARKYHVDLLKAGWDYDQAFINYEPYKMQYIQQSGQLFTSGRAVTNNPEISNSMKVKHQLNSGKYVILLKSLTTTPVDFIIQIGENRRHFNINTDGELKWNHGGIVNLTEDTDSLLVESPQTSSLIIDHFILVPEQQYIEETKSVETILAKMNVYEIQYPSSPHPNLRYDITVDTVRLEKPTQYLTYNFSYGEHWNANVHAEKFISNGYGMTFISNDKNISQIEYTPNKYYKISLAISVVTLLIMLLYLGIGFKRKWYKG